MSQYLLHPSTFDVTTKGSFSKVVKKKDKEKQLDCHVNTSTFELKQI